MAIYMQDVFNIINAGESSSVIQVIFEYGALKKQLDNLEVQSWYFKRAVPSKQAKLATLNKRFEEIRTTFNETPIDDFIQKIKENNILKAKYEVGRIGMIYQMAYASIRSQNTFLTELIRLRSLTDFLMPIDYYIENSDELIKLMD